MFHVELAKRRADETRLIVNDPNKASNVASTVADLRSEMATIGDKLNQNDGVIGADVAQEIKKNTDQITDVLQNAKTDLLADSTAGSDSLAEDVKATKDLVQDVTSKAVEVMVTKNLEGDTSVSKDEVTAAVNSLAASIVSEAATSSINLTSSTPTIVSSSKP